MENIHFIKKNLPREKLLDICSTRNYSGVFEDKNLIREYLSKINRTKQTCLSPFISTRCYGISCIECPFFRRNKEVLIEDLNELLKVEPIPTIETLRRMFPLYETKKSLKPLKLSKVPKCLTIKKS